MRYSELVQAPKLMVRRKTAEAMVEHAGIIDSIIKARWAEPVKVNQIDLFFVADIQSAIERLKREGLPR